MATTEQMRRVIAAALTAGIPVQEIADTHDLDVAYIEALQHDVTFQALMAINRGEDITSRKNDLLDTIELDLLEAINTNIGKFARTPQNAMTLLRTVNGARRDATLSEKVRNNSLVEIELPVFLTKGSSAISHKVNENNEIIEVEGRSLITQSSEKLMKHLDAARVKKNVFKIEELPPDNIAEFIESVDQLPSVSDF